MNVLVAYATSHGSTKEIAERIQSVIANTHTQDGPQPTTTCLPVKEVGPDITQYTHVVLGSAIHGKKWLSSATAFINEHKEQLNNRPVWAFSVGFPRGMPAPETFAAEEAKIIEEELQKSVRVRQHALFNGRFLTSDLGACFAWFFKCFGGSFGDQREWDKIEDWARTVKGEMDST